MTRHRKHRSGWLPRAALAVVVAPLVAALVVAPAAWAEEAMPPADETVQIENGAEAAPGAAAPEAMPDVVPEAELATDVEPTPDIHPTPTTASSSQASVVMEPGFETVVKAVTPVLEPDQSFIVNRTITGARGIVVALVGEPGDKRIELVTPNDVMSATRVSDAVAVYRLETGAPLPDGSYRILLHNLSDRAMSFAYEIAWRPAEVTFTPQSPRDLTGLVVATEVLLDGEPLPEGTTATVRATGADGAELTGTLRRDADTPHLWRAYLGAVVGGFVVEARFDTGSAVYTDAWGTRSYSLDTSPPGLGYVTLPAASNARGWFARPVAVTLSASDSGSGVDRIEWQVDGGAAQEVLSSVAEISLGHGEHALSYRAIDFAGNATGWFDRTVRIDTVAPTVSALVPSPGAEYLLGETVIVDFACADELSGVLTCTSPLAPGDVLPTDTEGDFTVEVVSTDRAGNILRMPVAYRVVDPGLPTVTLDLPQPDGADDWYLDFPTLDLRASTDAAELRWVDTVDGEPVTGGSATSTGSFTPDREGVHEFRFWAVDGLGRTGEPVTVEFKIDASAPVITVRTPVSPTVRAALAPGDVLQGSRLLADFACADAVSGLTSCLGSTFTGEQLPTDTLGRHEFTVTATDAAGHSVRQVVTYRVVAAASGLAATGAEVAPWLVAVGLVLLVGGATAVAATRRRPGGQDA